MTDYTNENWISPEVRHLLDRVIDDVRRVEALEALFIGRSAASLPLDAEDPE